MLDADASAAVPHFLVANASINSPIRLLVASALGLGRNYHVHQVFRVAIAHCCAIFACAQESDLARSEASAYFQASQSHMDNLSDYDVTVRVEQTAVIGNFVVPLKISRWRIRLESAKEFYFLAFLERELDVRELDVQKGAVPGALDRWQTRGSVLIADSKHVKMHVPGNGVNYRQFANFQAALDESERPTFTHMGLGEFSETCFNPKAQRDRLARVLAAADKLVVNPVRGRAQVLIEARFRDYRAVETHAWRYQAENLLPENYVIKQMPRLFGKETNILTQDIKWKEIAGLGWVPITVESIQPIRLKMESEDGKARFLGAERLDDVTLDWKPVDKRGRKADLIKDVYTLLDIAKIVGTDDGLGP